MTALPARTSPHPQAPVYPRGSFLAGFRPEAFGALDPALLEPRGNMRQVCGQLTLLEDHLNHPWRRCPDCIQKHFLKIEALTEEALDLNPDPETAHQLWAGLLATRMAAAEWVDGAPPEEIATILRALRKAWMPLCFDVGLQGHAR